MNPGDEFIMEWEPWDVQRYRVVSVEVSHIIAHRWIATQKKWAPWTVRLKKSRLVTARPCLVGS